MSSLTALNISSLSAYGGTALDPREGLGQSAFEWIAEGCKALITLDMSNSIQLDNIALIKIGQQCKLLQRLNISKCLQIDDEGIIGFFLAFPGAISHLDLSGCILCTSAAVAAISLCPPDRQHRILPTATSAALQEIKLNGLAKVTAKSLTSLWTHAPQLHRFEMACELASSSTHRKSTMPHFSDAVMLQADYSNLREVILTGCCLVTDRGLCALIDKCGLHLRSLDVSGCSAVTENLLLKLASKTCNCRIASITANGCIKMANTGLAALCNSDKASAITELNFNGCSMLTDLGLNHVCRLTNLEILSIRGCDQVTEPTIINISSSCRKLREVEISNLDLVGSAAVMSLVRNCQGLTSLACEGCNIVEKEFLSCVSHQLPFAQAAIGKCRLELQPRPVREYNNHILTMREKHRHCFTIQRFMRMAAAVTVVRFMRKMRIKNRKQLKRIFKALKQVVHRSSRESLRKLQGRAAMRLQRLLRRCFAVCLARRKARRLRLERDSCLTIQRVFRGFKSRKNFFWKFRAHFRQMTAFRNIGRKIILLQSARRLHTRILLVQEFGRTFAIRVRYLRMRSGFVVLQRRFKVYFAKKQVQDVVDHELERVLAEERKRHRAARTIQYNLKAALFNYEMSKFILVSCIHYRTEYDLHKWHSTILQKRWRGFMVRLKIKRHNKFQALQYRSAAMIQSVVRRRYCRKRYLPYRNFMRILFKRWGRLIGGPRRVRLRLGIYAKKIQKCRRRFVYDRILNEAAVAIQRVYRGHFDCKKHHSTIFAKEIALVNKIKYCYKLYKCRQMRYAMWARMHMAVYKIQDMVWVHFNIKRIMKQNALDKIREQELNVQIKKQLAIERRNKTVEKIRQDAVIARIVHLQRRVRAWLLRRRERKEQQIKDLEKQLLKDALKAEEDELAAKNNVSVVTAVAHSIGNAGRAVVSTVAKLNKAMFGSTDIVSEDERTLIVNAVLKYQVKNILQEGITHFHLTVGEMEYKAFQGQQNTFKGASLPHMEVVANDLSGSLELNVHLWTQIGVGLDCITQLVVKEKSEHISNEGMKLLVSDGASKNLRIVWHPHLPFYLEGACSIRQGKSDFAIEAVRIANSVETKREIFRLNKMIANGIADQGQGSLFREAGDLSRFGFHECSIWISSRLPTADDDEEILYKFGKLSQMSWYDARLRKVVKSFNLSESDVFALRGVFDDMLQGRVKTSILIEEVFMFLNYPYGRISKWVYESIKPLEEGHICFSEYVHMVGYFVMFAVKDLVKFLFSCTDDEGKQYIRRDQFNMLLDHLAQNSPFNVRVWKLQYEQYHDPKLKFMFLTNFQAFMTNNPSALWQATLLQRQMMKANLGVAYWENKMEQFRLIREELGIKQL